MTQTAEKKRKSPTYKITPSQFEQQLSDIDHKDLIAIRELITKELESRRERAEKLVEELKGGKG